MVVLCLRLFIDLFPFCSLFLYAVLRLSQSRPRHPAHGRWIPALRLRYQRSQSQRLGHQRKYLYLLRPGIAVVFEDVYVYGWMVYVCDADFLLPSEQHTSARQREMRVMDFCGKKREPKGRDNDLQTIRRSSKVVLADVIVPEQMGQEQRERANDPCYSLSLSLPRSLPVTRWAYSLLGTIASHSVCRLRVCPGCSFLAESTPPRRLSRRRWGTPLSDARTPSCAPHHLLFLLPVEPRANNNKQPPKVNSMAIFSRSARQR